MCIMEHADSFGTGDLSGNCEKSIYKVADGDISELTQIYGCFKRPVFLIAYSIVKDYALAEDVMQETFLRVSEKASTYRGGNSKSWVLEIARNIALNCVKKRNWETISADESESMSPSVEDAAVAEADFTRAITVLDEVERSIVILHLAGSLKHTEIAHILGIMPGDVRIRYFRALKKLKAYYRFDSFGKHGNRINE
jgi:RNA polymerase sigma-70 factor, ECF subfamily